MKEEVGQTNSQDLSVPQRRWVPPSPQLNQPHMSNDLDEDTNLFHMHTVQSPELPHCGSPIRTQGSRRCDERAKQHNQSLQ